MLRNQIESVESFTTLPREYYLSSEMWEREVKSVFPRQWHYAGHVSQLDSDGSFFLCEIAGESLIVVKGEDGVVSAFYNVCRHRGFRICEEPGTVKKFVCPYHAWSYRLDGSLLHAPTMPDGKFFGYQDFGLEVLPAGVWNGLIFVNFEEDPEPLEAALAQFETDLTRFDLSNTKLACERTYEINANWKLVVENQLECYHCAGQHKTLCNTVDLSKLLSDIEGWFDTTVEVDHIGQGGDGMPLREGMKTMSLDGSLISSKFLGTLRANDAETGTNSGLLLIPNFLYVGCYVDHWFAQAVRPTSAGHTVVILQWFVHADAVEGRDYDVEDLIAIGDITTREDVALIERNQRGVSSRRFRPGPISARSEPMLQTNKEVYLSLIGD